MRVQDEVSRTLKYEVEHCITEVEEIRWNPSYVTMLRLVQACLTAIDVIFWVSSIVYWKILHDILEEFRNHIQLDSHKMERCIHSIQKWAQERTVRTDIVSETDPSEYRKPREKKKDETRSRRQRAAGFFTHSWQTNKIMTECYGKICWGWVCWVFLAYTHLLCSISWREVVWRSL